jgi:formylglycine-generating enzyme required for sulfatase activity
MIDRLLTTLQAAQLLTDRELDPEAQSLLDDEDIADALWLAAHIGRAYEAEAEDPAEATEMNPALQVIDADGVMELPAMPPMASVYLPPVNRAEPQPIAAPESGLPIQIQAAPALPDTRNLARSLRPLMRKVPSLTRSELDAMATVDRIAERDIWVPILRPSPERWFDLELVIEASPFSFIWQETLDEFQHLLESQGAFRRVRAWFVQAAAGDLKLVAKNQHHRTAISASPTISTSATSTINTESVVPLRSPKELIDASGRRLVLVVSDCRSRLWQQGQMHDWLKLWGNHGPTAIVQLLPERLWRQSELDVGFAAQVGALVPGLPNPKLLVRELPPRTQVAAADALTLPVVTLTAKALKQWALVVAAAGRQRTPARLFDLAWVKDPKRDRSRAVFQPQSPQARLELFEATASPLAQQLARRMAAVPVELPVVYLIQQELLPALQPEHIAEVYDSVLLEEKLPEEKSNSSPDGVTGRYDFADGVRELLNRSTPLDETIDVLEALSRRIARTLGFEIKSFTALLSPRSGWSQAQKDTILPFAQVALDVLRRLGGDYAELAELVEREPGRGWGPVAAPDGNPDDADDEVSWELETFDFTTAQFGLLEPERSARPVNLQPFEFMVATLQRSDTPRRKGPQKSARWVIQRQEGRGMLWVEPLGAGEQIELEMVAIPAGKFLMGSPQAEPDRRESEDPQHEVHVSAFYLGRYPITQSQWRVVAGWPRINRELQPDPARFKGDRCPVEQIDWYEAVEFCNRLSAFTHRTYRLPTEAEWEYACRAGTTTPFHFGAVITAEVANYRASESYNGSPKGEYRQKTTPVDYFEFANAWGLSDMHGNVFEWCQDHWHDNYEGAPTDGTAWLNDAEEDARVIRGGSWYYYPRYCRSAFRYLNNPRGTSQYLGFRVVCGAPRTLP